MYQNASSDINFSLHQLHHRNLLKLWKSLLLSCWAAFEAWERSVDKSVEEHRNIDLTSTRSRSLVPLYFIHSLHSKSHWYNYSRRVYKSIWYVVTPAKLCWYNLWSVEEFPFMLEEIFNVTMKYKMCQIKYFNEVLRFSRVTENIFFIKNHWYSSFSLNITDFYGPIGTFIACLFFFAAFLPLIIHFIIPSKS